MITNTDKITIPDRGTDPDDTCAAVIDREDAAERCLIEADALPDGAPEQISVLLRGLLASQLAMLRMMVSITEKLDAWPHFATCGDPGFTCLDRTCRDCYPIAR